MKNLICISGLVGIILILGIFLGIITGYSQNILYLISGLIVLGIICFISTSISTYHRRKKIKGIIKNSRIKKDRKTLKKETLSKNKSTGIKDFTFRKRKTGLTWGGGNIHGANVKRGERKSFLKR